MTLERLTPVKTPPSGQLRTVSRQVSDNDPFLCRRCGSRDDVSNVSSGDLSIKSHHDSTNDERENKKRYVIRGVIFISCLVAAAAAIISVAIYLKFAPDSHLTPLLTSMKKTSTANINAAANSTTDTISKAGTLTLSADALPHNSLSRAESSKTASPGTTTTTSGGGPTQTAPVGSTEPTNLPPI